MPVFTFNILSVLILKVRLIPSVLLKHVSSSTIVSLIISQMLTPFDSVIFDGFTDGGL